MSDRIHLLPDSIANQIAAGEVIQRPASVVKELVENAIDAGATQINVLVKDAGKTLIQVIDNGDGMSETDARMAFERHATSKIANADDLFALRTMGFRGEALASIAAVAHVELRTRRKGSDLGTHLSIEASNLQRIEAGTCDQGSNFSVKNLFFNIPARRKFLKSNDVELRHILNEFERIALVNPQVQMTLIRDDVELFQLPGTALRQRIVNVCGKGLNNKLLTVDAQSSMVTITGFAGRPDATRKRGYLQYLFVNGRFMKHPYFHKAILQAYENLIPGGDMPDYFIYFTLDPAAIDVNIHPTKTEIKFENEHPIRQILYAAIREALGKANAAPPINFDTEGAIHIPAYNPNDNTQPIKMPNPTINPAYNPFNADAPRHAAPSDFDWSRFYQQFEEEQPAHTKSEILEEAFNNCCYQYKGRYIATSLKSGLAIIDQRRAHIRVLYDRYYTSIRRQKGLSQQILFPEIIEFTAAEAVILPTVMEDLARAGFDISNLGDNTYAINGVPAGTEQLNPSQLIKDALYHAIETGNQNHTREKVSEAIALSLAKATAIPTGKTLSVEEMNSLIASLFSCTTSSTYTPEGKLILTILTDDEIDNRFK